MEPVDLLSDEDENKTDDEELPDINLPSCSSKGLSKPQEKTRSQLNGAPNSLQEFPDLLETLNAAAVNEKAGNKRRPVKKTAAARGAKKQKQEEEKAAKQLKNEELNIYKPAQCMKHMCVEVHPVLASLWFMAELGRELEAAGARLRSASSLVDPGLLVWTRVLPQKLTAEDGQVKLGPSKQHCGMSLYICTADELAERLGNGTLVSHVSSLREMVDGDMSMVVFGDCFKSSGRKTSNSNRKNMTELQLDRAKIELLLETGVDMQVMDKQNDLVMWVVQCTRAVAEKPYKQSKMELEAAAADFYIRGDKKKCVAVNKEGHGLSRLWQQMIAVLPSSSLEISRALYDVYRTPAKLMETLQKPDGVKEVAEVSVTRAAVPGSKKRRIGPEFARKLHLLYTSIDPNMVID